MALAKPRESYSPQITIDAPIMIPDDYVPDLAVRMALYRRLNDLEEAGDIEGFAAEMTDRFGAIPIPGAKPAAADRDQAECARCRGFQDRGRTARRAGQFPSGQPTQCPGSAHLCGKNRCNRQVATGQQAGDHAQLAPTQRQNSMAACNCLRGLRHWRAKRPNR